MATLSLPNARTQVSRLRNPKDSQDGFNSAATAVNTIQDALDVMGKTVNTLLAASGTGTGTGASTDDTAVTIRNSSVIS